uniref:Uncharacterized protein n=1 Tax=Canis lupus familiaris TaxID=9615 RepID=A0A8I3S2P0_CANLF
RVSSLEVSRESAASPARTWKVGAGCAAEARSLGRSLGRSGACAVPRGPRATEPQEAQLCHNETPPCGPHGRLPPLPDSTGAFNFERPCYLRGGNCLKRGTPNCEPFRGPCRAFTVCCKAKGSGRKRSSQGTLAPRAKARLPLSKYLQTTCKSN